MKLLMKLNKRMQKKAKYYKAKKIKYFYENY